MTISKYNPTPEEVHPILNKPYREPCSNLLELHFLHQLHKPQRKQNIRGQRFHSSSAIISSSTFIKASHFQYYTFITVVQGHFLEVTFDSIKHEPSSRLQVEPCNQTSLPAC